MKKIIFILIFAVFLMKIISGVILDADYMTMYSGETKEIKIEIENNENFDIEEISVSLDLENLPFVFVGSSVKETDEIEEGDDKNFYFNLKSSADAIPGDYNIKYILNYASEENLSMEFEKTGSFGIRISAKTDLDFGIEVLDNAIIGEKGQISLDIINRGLGDIKSVSVEIFPQGFELLSKEKVFIGTIPADDSDSVAFDVLYKTKNPSLSAKIEYKDFENQERVETIDIPIKTYTKEEAFELGILEKPKHTFYFILGGLIIIFIAYKTWKKIKKK